MIPITISSIHDIDTAAEQLISFLDGHNKVAFSGEMGAGKTTLIQSICRVLGVKESVNSPTFALINEYFTCEGESIFHFDLYRIEDITEMFDFGYEDYFYSDDYCFIEWPEKALELIPDDFIFIRIDVQDNGSRTVRALDN